MSHLESVLQAKYHFYSHADGKGQQITSDTYVVPGEVAEHIDFITPAMAVSTKVESPTRVEKSIAAGSKVPNPTKPKPLPAQVVQKLQANLGVYSHARKHLIMVTFQQVTDTLGVQRAPSTAATTSLHNVSRLFTTSLAASTRLQAIAWESLNPTTSIPLRKI